MQMINEITKPRFRSTFYFEGKRYETTGKNQKEADKKAAIKLDKLQRGEAGISSDMTVERWAREWLETYKKPVVGDWQYKDYLMYIKRINEVIGSQKIKNVKDIHLQRILNEHAGKSKSYLHKLRVTIKAIFLRAYKSRLIVYNPADDIIIPAAKDGTHRSITDYERKKILELTVTHRAGLWIKAMLYCGLRPGETRALNWCHVDFNKQLIHVKQAMKAGTKKIGAPKSEAGIRDIPVPLIFLPDLQAACGKPDEPVFKQAKTDKRHTKTSMRQMWDSFKHQLDISMGAKTFRNQIIESKVSPDLQPYCLRHTYCTDLEIADVPINISKNLMGHSSILLTSKIYTHTSEKAVQSAAKKINKFNKVENMVE